MADQIVHVTLELVICDRCFTVRSRSNFYVNSFFISILSQLLEYRGNLAE